jgi:hypothetical protein
MAITNGYATLAQLKAALRISDTVDDSLLETSIESASRQIDGACERVFYSTSGSRVYRPTDSFTCEIDDLSTLTTLKTSSRGDGVFDITWTALDRQLEPLNGLSGGSYRPFDLIRAVGEYLFPLWDPKSVNNYEATVQVTGVFGWTTVPTDIKQATILLAMRQFKRYDSPLGVAGFGDLGVIRVGRIDPDIESLIMPYKKIRMA